MYEEEMLKIKRVIKEIIDLSFYDLGSEGRIQFQVDSIDGEKLPEDTVIIIAYQKDVSLGQFRGYAVTQMDFSNVFGKFEVFHCRKKKGMFGKTSLKTLNMIKYTYHISGLESGEEQPISLRELMNRK